MATSQQLVAKTHKHAERTHLDAGRRDVARATHFGLAGRIPRRKDKDDDDGKGAMGKDAVYIFKRPLQIAKPLSY